MNFVKTEGFSDTVKGFVGLMTVEQTTSRIIIRGIDGHLVVKKIADWWQTSRIGPNIFTKVTGKELQFPLFFAVDVYYLFKCLVEQKEVKYVPVPKLRQAMELLLEKTWLASTISDQPGRLDFTALDLFRWTPEKDQQAFLEYYNSQISRYNLKGTLVNGAPGSGKTFIGVATACCLRPDVVIVVSPKNALDRVWQGAFIANADPAKQMFKQPPGCWMANSGDPYRGQKFIVGHYEALPALLTLAPRMQEKRVVILLDESHNLNTSDTVRSQSFYELCKITQSQDILFLSGTPVKALGQELIPLFRIIDPYFTPNVEERFKAIHGAQGKKTLDLLNHRLGKVQFIIRKEELGLEKPEMLNLPVRMPKGDAYTLPEVKAQMTAFVKERQAFYDKRKPQDEAFFKDALATFERIAVHDKAQRQAFAVYRDNLSAVCKAYRARALETVKEEIKACNGYEKRVIIPNLPQEFKERFKDVRSIIKYVRLKIQGECLGRILGRLRIGCHVDMVPYIDYLGIINSAQKKTVIFTTFVEVVEKAMEHLRGLGLTPVSVYGKNNTELATILKRFETDPEVNPLVATYASLSTAVPLVMADTMLLINTPFRDYILQQAIARIWRRGMTGSSTVYTAILDTGDVKNLSDRTLDILSWSQQMAEAITGVSSPFEMSENAESTQFTLEDYDIAEIYRAYQDTPRLVVPGATFSW